MRIMKKLSQIFLLLFLLPLALHAAWWTATDPANAWHQADWSSAGVLPPPSAKREAIIHVYAARVGRWRGIFAHHSWIVIKERGADKYSRFDKTFWGNPIKSNNWPADARWFGHNPVLVGALEGPSAEALIPKIRAAVQNYPYRQPGSYQAWPGPNSNTFVAHVLRSVPELGIALLPTAIGKDWLPSGALASSTPSGTGWQASLFGLIGISVGLAEGLEINALGLIVGIDPVRPAIKLPGFGRISLQF
jgi:Protein of unknown function (DUF3750)